MGVRFFEVHVNHGNGNWTMSRHDPFDFSLPRCFPLRPEGVRRFRVGYWALRYAMKLRETRK